MLGFIKMTKNSDSLAKLLRRREGMSLIAVIVILAILVAVGGVYSSLMSRWQTSAPITLNSSKAFYLAELYAQLGIIYLRDGISYTGSTTCQVSMSIPNISSIESGAYGVCGPDVTGVDDLYIIRSIGVVGPVQSSPSTWWDQATCDFIVPAAELPNIRALRKIKEEVYKTGERIDMPAQAYVEGGIIGNPDFTISDGVGGSVTYDNVGNVSAGDPTGLVTNTVPVDSDSLFNILINMAVCQNNSCGNHYYPSPGSLGLSWGPQQSGWPCDENGAGGSFYYHDDSDNSKDIPNIVYINGNLTVTGNTTVNGIFAIEGDDIDISGEANINGIIIFRGDGTIRGGGSPGKTEALGVIAYGTLTGNGSNTDVQITEALYDTLDNIASSSLAPYSWEEEISS